MNRFKKHARSGSVLAEMMIAMPVLFTVLVIVADMGRVVAIKSALTTASDNGARQGALTPPQGTSAANWAVGIEAAVTDHLSGYSWYSAGDLTIGPPTTVDCNGLACVRVTLTYEFRPLFDLDGLIHPITVAVAATQPMVR